MMDTTAAPAIEVADLSIYYVTVRAVSSVSFRAMSCMVTLDFMLLGFYLNAMVETWSMSL